MVDRVLRGRAAAGDRAISNEAIGHALGIHEKRFRVMRSGEAPISLGDVMAMSAVPATKAAAREIARALLALVEADAPCGHIAPEIRTLALMEHAGQLCAIVREANADGVIDEEKHQRIAHAAGKVMGEAQSMIRQSTTSHPTPGLSKATARISASASRAALRTAGGAR